MVDDKIGVSDRMSDASQPSTAKRGRHKMNTVANMMHLLAEAIDKNGNLHRGASAKYDQVMQMNHNELAAQHPQVAADIANINLSDYALTVRLHRTIACLERVA